MGVQRSYARQGVAIILIWGVKQVLITLMFLKVHRIINPIREAVRAPLHRKI